MRGPRSGEFTIRRAVAADESTIQRLVRRAGINPFGLKWQRFLVAVGSDGAVIGCGQLKPHRDEILELASLVVQKEWRGSGVGAALIEALIQRADRELWLMCRSSLRGLYQKHAFREVREEAVLPRYFRRMRKLAGLVELLARTGEYLAVMVRRRPAEP